MHQQNLLVVIVCYRAAGLVIECVRSIAPQRDGVPGLHVAVCENGTGPEAVEQLCAAVRANGWGDWVTVTPVSPNRGFAGGNNVILKEHASRYRYALLLNADTIVRPGALKALVEAAETNPRAGVIGPRLEWPDGAPQESAFLDFTLAHEFIKAASTGPVTRLFRRGHGAIEVTDEAADAEWVSFACALIRREVLQRCGLLDEGYYLYFDDADYCRRARVEGWRTLYYPAARVVHLRGQSNPLKSLAAERNRRPRYWYLSRNRYYAKFYGRRRLWLANVLWTAGRCVSLARELVGNRARTACRAEWRDIWINAWSPMRPPRPSDHQHS